MARNSEICGRCRGPVERGLCYCSHRDLHLEHIREVTEWVEKHLGTPGLKMRPAQIGAAALNRSRRRHVSSDASRREEQLGYAIAYQDADPSLKPKHVRPRSLPPKSVYTEII